LGTIATFILDCAISEVVQVFPWKQLTHSYSTRNLIISFLGHAQLHHKISPKSVQAHGHTLLWTSCDMWLKSFVIIK